MKHDIIISNSIERFRTEFLSGINGIARAAEIYVEAIDDDPHNVNEFREEFADWIPTSAWSQFEAVGRKWLHPKMIMGGMADHKKATFVKRLPYSIQERIFNHEQFPLLAGEKTLQIDILEATDAQVKQLCNQSSIRSLPEQRVWIEAQELEATEKTEVMPYTISDGKLRIRRGVTLIKAEVERILKEM